MKNRKFKTTLLSFDELVTVLLRKERLPQMIRKSNLLFEGNKANKVTPY
jgi:hypothetical protein